METFSGKKKNYYLPHAPPQHMQKQKLKQTNEQTATLAYVLDPAVVLLWMGGEVRQPKQEAKLELFLSAV